MEEINDWILRICCFIDLSIDLSFGGITQPTPTPRIIAFHHPPQLQILQGINWWEPQMKITLCSLRTFLKDLPL